MYEACQRIKKLAQLENESISPEFNVDIQLRRIAQTLEMMRLHYDLAKTTLLNFYGKGEQKVFGTIVEKNGEDFRPGRVL